jgi:uroporphyrinogen-III synthase
VATTSNIVSTKKLLPNQKQLLLDANITVFDKDFIEIKIKNFELVNVNQNLIFTSQNAVKSVLQHPKCGELQGKNVFCVGIKTKEFLEENGSEVAVYTDYASDLAEIISLIYADETFTFFCGNLRKDILPNTLHKNGIIFNEIEVYETNSTSHKIQTKANGILFFSPSAVESYLKNNTIKHETCFCIGETTAEALQNKKVKNIVIAESPSIENVIAEVIEYYN